MDKKNISLDKLIKIIFWIIFIFLSFLQISLTFSDGVGLVWKILEKIHPCVIDENRLNSFPCYISTDVYVSLIIIVFFLSYYLFISFKKRNKYLKIK